MREPLRHITLIIAGIFILAANAVGQRISFGLYATEGILLTPQGTGGLNFNDKKQLILGGHTVQVDLADEAVAVLTIEGRADLDVTVTITPDPTLDLDVDNKIPLAVRFAYANRGADSEVQAKTEAMEIPAGFTSVTFPMLRRASGLPAPPPVPAHQGYTPPEGTAWLFIYGTLGPVPQNAAAGLYTGNIDIHVTYSTYE